MAVIISKSKSTINCICGVRPKKPLSGYNIYVRLATQHMVNFYPEGKDAVTSTFNDIIKMDEDELLSIAIEITRKYRSLGHQKDTNKKQRKSHGVIGFLDLSNAIANQWKLHTGLRSILSVASKMDKETYIIQRDIWLKKKDAKIKQKLKEQMVCEENANSNFVVDVDEGKESSKSFNLSQQFANQNDIYLSTIPYPEYATLYHMPKTFTRPQDTFSSPVISVTGPRITGPTIPLSQVGLDLNYARYNDSLLSSLQVTAPTTSMIAETPFFGSQSISRRNTSMKLNNDSVFDPFHQWNGPRGSGDLKILKQILINELFDNE